ncbi:MAG TPA: serine/threonine-protein kinase, partial [Candidatus Polarisedimenticolia bacterium]|nr:serine/threonine-protein kinase [Candidatus Polarisedimenticolia bacterium]
MICPGCGTKAPESARYCHVCGDPLQHASVSPTMTHLEGGSPARSPSPPRSPSFSRDTSGSSGARRGERFAPGFVLAERYRIVGVLGRGGMGEVYRADDLMLDQAVALKFLPEALAADQERLARLLDEVRLTRQVSHPNVCRVYDAGRADSLHFLTMEFVDGEDLATLLRRIGRLPQDKAVEVARQICAGLSAAHERGVLHRDLKPANIMIDGRGKARITDFGLASLAEESGLQGRSGTPAYMAPEQLQGEQASVRSDVYALGLVLHELFTGKPAFRAASSMAELIAIRRDSASAVSPSSVVEALDPAVERTILRCLEPDPRARPASALAVAAALPGGDPLAAALAAGETPSPEMVAASGEEGTLSMVMGAALYAGFLLLMAGAVFLSDRLLLIRQLPFTKPPAVLVDRAQELLKKFSPTLIAADSAWGFSVNSVYLDYLENEDTGPARWEPLRTGRPSGIQFWYRQGPRPLEALGANSVVNWSDPAPTVPGMAAMVLDPSGRLVELSVVPPQQDDPNASHDSPDYTALFAEAGLDFASFTPAEPRWVPPDYAERRHAWEGSFPGSREPPIRVEAAENAGVPVYFQVLGPWSKPTRAQPVALSTKLSWAQ